MRRSEGRLSLFPHVFSMELPMHVWVYGTWVPPDRCIWRVVVITPWPGMHRSLVCFVSCFRRRQSLSFHSCPHAHRDQIRRRPVVDSSMRDSECDPYGVGLP